MINKTAKLILLQYFEHFISEAKNFFLKFLFFFYKLGSPHFIFNLEILTIQQHAISGIHFERSHTHQSIRNNRTACDKDRHYNINPKDFVPHINLGNNHVVWE